MIIIYNKKKKIKELVIHIQILTLSFDEINVIYEIRLYMDIGIPCRPCMFGKKRKKKNNNKIK